MSRFKGVGRAGLRAATATNAMVLGIVLVAAAVSAVLLLRTMNAADRINDKAMNIAQTGRGINIATDSVIQLNRTNEAAGSILESATPLEGKLSEIVTLAQAVDGLAGSIDGNATAINATAGDILGTAGRINASAGEINGTAKKINGTAGAIGDSAKKIGGSAGTINATAKGINAEAVDILDVARRIDKDVRLINENLDVTIGLVNDVKKDTGDVLKQAQAAQRNASCIDVNTGGLNDGHC
jgi:methyl-accepting chemotaxis protein